MKERRIFTAIGCLTVSVIDVIHGQYTGAHIFTALALLLVNL